MKLTNLNDITAKQIQICSIKYSLTIRIYSGIREYVETIRKTGEVEVFTVMATWNVVFRDVKVVSTSKCRRF